MHAAPRVALALVTTLMTAYPGNVHAKGASLPEPAEPPSTISVSLTADAPHLGAITVGESFEDQIPVPTTTPVDHLNPAQDDPGSTIGANQYDVSYIKQIARQICDQAFGDGQFGAMSDIIEAESGWDIHAEEPRTHAYGLGQALPASKMEPYGGDYLDNPATQLRWLVAYIRGRYGNPEIAWSFHLAHGWY